MVDKLDILKKMFELEISSAASKDYAREKEYYRNREYDSEKLILNSLLYGNAGALSVFLAFLGTQAEKETYLSSIKYSLLFFSLGLFFSFLGLVFLNSESSNRVSQFNFLNNKQNCENALDKMSRDRKWALVAESLNVPIGYNDESTQDSVFELKDKMNQHHQKAIEFGESADKHKKFVARFLLLAVGSFALAFIIQGVLLFYGFA